MPFLSIVVPVLNEAELIGAFLTRLRSIAPAAEVIVVDGGSCDETRAVAAPFVDRMVSGPPKRALQMNAGAAVAHGEVLWFLHADSIAPANAICEMQNALADRQIAGGCFRLRFPRAQLIYRVSDSLGNLGVEIFGFALGDHGIFCRRAAFDKTGGYPDVPILEDAEMYRRLRWVGRMRQLRAKIISNPRAYEERGPWRTTTIYFCILAFYIFGVPIRLLNRIYQNFRGRPDTAKQLSNLSSVRTR